MPDFLTHNALEETEKQLFKNTRHHRYDHLPHDIRPNRGVNGPEGPIIPRKHAKTWGKRTRKDKSVVS